MGGLAIDELIANQMSVDLSEAERTKIDLSERISILDLARKFSKQVSTEALSDNQRILLELLKIIDRWIYEIDNIIKYYKTRNRSNIVDKVYIFGGCSLFKDIDKYFESKLNTPTSKLSDFGSVICPSKHKDDFPNFISLLGSLIIN